MASLAILIGPSAPSQDLCESTCIILPDFFDVHASRTFSIYKLTDFGDLGTPFIKNEMYHLYLA